MIALSVARLKMLSPERNFSRNKATKKKKKRFCGNFDQFRRLEVCEKLRNVFVVGLRLSEHQVFARIS